MASTDQNITELPIKTASEVVDTDYLLGIDLVEGYQVTTKDFGSYVVSKATYTLNGSTQTVKSAIDSVGTTAANAQPKEQGKGLSANDFTNVLKTKLDNIESNADVNTIETIKKNGVALTPDGNKAVDISVPTKTSDLTNDSDFVEDANYVHTDNNYTSAEKQKLDGIEAGAQVNVNADWNAASGKTEVLHKPTSIAGYGITDAYTKSETDSALDTLDDKIDGLTASDIAADGVGEREISGNPIVVTDAMSALAKSLSVELEPIQDLHGYDHPWPAGGGKNLFGGTLSALTANEVLSSSVTLAAGTYTVSFASSKTPSAVYVREGNTSSGTVISYVYSAKVVTFTLAEQKEICMTVYLNTGIAPSEITNVQIEKGSSATLYAPYSNICPITPHTQAEVQRTGKNLFDGVNQSYYINSGANYYGRADGDSGSIICVKGLSYVTVSTTASQERYRIALCNEFADMYGSNKPAYSGVNKDGTSDPITINTTAYDYLIINATDLSKIQVEPGSTATEYEPYSAQSALIPFTSDVYGGTVDFNTGELTVTRGSITYSDSTDFTLNSVRNGYGIFQTIIADGALFTNISQLLSNTLATSSYSEHPDYWDNPSKDALMLGISYSTNGIFALILYGVTDLTALGMWLTANHLTLAYELATPQTYHLTPAQLTMLDGTNVLTSDGTIDLAYLGTVASNVQDEIDEFENGVNRLSERLTPILGNFATIEQQVATQNHSIGDYMVVGDKLYKAITAIASGETLNALNTAQTNVAAEIASLGSIVVMMKNDIIAPNAGAHNGIYRGKYLGTEVTAEQWAEIGAGTFNDLYIGDYWIINNVVWRIAAFDYWLHTGNTECTTHHIVIVPDTNLLVANGSTTHFMNTVDTTAGGYIGSGFFSGVNADDTTNTAKADCIAIVNAAFGSGHILTHREYFSNAVTNGYVSGGSWTDSTVDLMSEAMVYGTIFFENQINGTTAVAAYTIDKTQLPLFAHEPSRICNRATWWLRSVASDSGFARVHDNGYCTWNSATDPWSGVRPYVGIKAA